MHSGKPQNEADPNMTLSPQTSCDSSVPTETTSAVSRPFEIFSSPEDQKGLPKIRRKAKGRGRQDAAKLGPHHQLLPNKLKLNKSTKNEVAGSAYLNTNHNVYDYGRGEIRVLSPSIVNSQVLPRTLPLSPECLSIPPELQDENKNTSLRLSGKEQRNKKNQDTMKDKNEEEKDQESSKGKGKGKRRQRLFKLKFHHQALPPEYLDHYEASLKQQQKQANSYTNDIRDQFERENEGIHTELQSGLRQGLRTKVNKALRDSRPITIHQSGNGTTEALLRDLLVSSPRLQQVALQQAAIARAQSVPSVLLASGNNKVGLHSMDLPPSSPVESMCADDQLSYASDMSIDDCSRKGRHSRKNSTSNKLGRGPTSSGLGTLSGTYNGSSHYDVNEIEPTSLISQYAVLEKQTLARSRSYSSIINQLDQNEPLNLCMRDESKDYEYNDNSFNIGVIKTEPHVNSDDDGEGLNINKEEDLNMQSPCITPYDYSSWPYSFSGNPHWLHDYRLKTEDGLSSGHSTPSMCSQSSHLPCLSPPVWPHFSPPPYSPSPLSPMSPLTPPHHSRHIKNLMKDSLHHKYDEATRDKLTIRDNCIRSPSRSSGISSSFRLTSLKGGGRKKRSALFIPPADNSTEVSICKFKFTGGANPILEEKKMVRVDASGNLRYFSGNDNCTLKENNIKFSGKMLESLSKCEKDVKKIRLESDNDETCSLPGGGIDSYSAAMSQIGALGGTVPDSCTLPGPIEDSPKRKRRSKKSSVREKLEQTLREKGLLIQTQQVESAEGATYCKFRQLRKITRYLFRSWKDYLPGHMHEDVTPTESANPYYHGSNMHQTDRQEQTYQR